MQDRSRQKWGAGLDFRIIFFRLANLYRDFRLALPAQNSLGVCSLCISSAHFYFAKSENHLHAARLHEVAPTYHAHRRHCLRPRNSGNECITSDTKSLRTMNLRSSKPQRIIQYKILMYKVDNILYLYLF